jgi:hypothetical protein
MGREIKRVAIDFDHPLDEVWPGYICPDENFDDATGEYIDWAPTEPPAGDGWQVWETVSEGSPITPVFPTADALVAHLSTVGTTWDQKAYVGRLAKGPWRREAAEAFVRDGWAPSFAVFGGVMLEGARDADRFPSRP